MNATLVIIGVIFTIAGLCLVIKYKKYGRLWGIFLIPFGVGILLISFSNVTVNLLGGILIVADLIIAFCFCVIMAIRSL